MHCCTGFLYLRIFHSLFSSFFSKMHPTSEEKGGGSKRVGNGAGAVIYRRRQHRTQFQSVVCFHLSIWLLCRCLLLAAAVISGSSFSPFSKLFFFSFLLFFSPGQWCKCSTDSHYIHSRRRCAILFGVCPGRCVCAHREESLLVR